MAFICRTKDHPEADHRTPISGERQYTLWFPLEDGTTLTVLMGAEGMRNLRNVVLDELIDDEFAGGN